MTDRELELMLAQALDRAAPDDLEGVLSRCGERRGNVIMLEQTNQNNASHQNPNGRKPARRSRWWMGLAAACLAVVLVAGGAAGGMWYQNNRAVASVISLDVNPSIELKVNQNERVLSCRGVNEDAAAVLADMDNGRDLEGSKLDVAVNAIVGALVRNGYLDDISSAILISVEDNNTDRAARLQAQLTATVDGVLQSAASQAGVLSQTMTVDAGLDSQAQQYGLSTGKAALINQVIALNPILKFEELAELSVEELRDLIRLNAPAMPIGRAQAEYNALAYAGALELDSAYTDVDPELDDSIPHYDVDLHTQFGEYEYMVDAFSGKVLSGQENILSGAGAQSPGTQLQPSQPQSSQAPATAAPQPSQAPATAAPRPTQAPIADIGAEAAKSAALRHAGLTGKQVRWLKAYKEYDDGRWEYELEFLYNNTEYDYTILASNGSVIKYETEPVRGAGGGAPSTPAPAQTPAPQSTQAPAADIGLEAAKAAALRHAGLTGQQVQWIKAQKDYDDGRWEYELEFLYNNTEYDYTILASNGSVIKYETEPARGAGGGAPSTPAPAQTPAPATPAPVQTPAPATPAPAADIGAEAAKAAALRHAGLSEGQVSRMEVERDREHGRIEYEISFKCNGYEYDYTIDGATGAILDHERDWDD